MSAKKKEIRVGVVGYGGAFNMGKVHLLECQAAGMIPAAVCDTDKTRLAAAKEDWKDIETYTSLKDMLTKSSVDLVTLITPHDSHAPLALQCLNAGKHVVVEKPMAIDTAECDKMIAAAKKSKVVLSTYHNRHWDGCILQAMKTVKSGVIGDVCRVNAHHKGYQKPRDWWRSRKSVSGGILYDWGVHILEYTLQIMDAEMTEVSGFMHSGFWAPQVKWSKDANEDEGFSVIRFKNGTWATLTVSDMDPLPAPAVLEIHGTKGVYLMRHLDYEIILPKKNETVVKKGRNPQNQGINYYKNVAAHLTKGEPLVITAEWARRPIHIIDLTQKSAAKGQAMKVKYG